MDGLRASTFAEATVDRTVDGSWCDAALASNTLKIAPPPCLCASVAKLTPQLSRLTFASAKSIISFAAGIRSASVIAR